MSAQYTCAMVKILGLYSHKRGWSSINQSINESINQSIVYIYTVLALAHMHNRGKSHVVDSSSSGFGSMK